jgi:hypothetical protein
VGPREVGARNESSGGERCWGLADGSGRGALRQNEREQGEMIDGETNEIQF